MSPAIFSAFARSASFLLALLPLVQASGCRGPGNADGPAPTGTPGSPGADASSQDPREIVARLEDARSDGEGVLEDHLSGGAEATRVLAATALGRLPFPDLPRF